MNFLQNMLGIIENENNFGGYVWWWIGLNDIEEEGNFVWLVNGPANYTWWDVDYGEPYEGGSYEISLFLDQYTVKILTM